MTREEIMAAIECLVPAAQFGLCGDAIGDVIWNDPRPQPSEAAIIDQIATLGQRYLVRKSVIIRRLQEAGQLAAAAQALGADLYTRERWYSPDQPSIYNDAAEALALLRAIGADPAIILAREG